MSPPASRIRVLRSSLAGEEETGRFNAAHGFLRSHLVATRDTPIGRDFLFDAAAAGVGGALRDLAGIEHEHGGDLHFDYTEVGGYYLLRIAGREDQRAEIEGYFD